MREDLDELYNEICDLVVTIQDDRLTRANFEMKITEGRIAVIHLRIPVVKKRYRNHGDHVLEFLSTSTGFGTSLKEIGEMLKAHIEARNS